MLILVACVIVGTYGDRVVFAIDDELHGGPPLKTVLREISAAVEVMLESKQTEGCVLLHNLAPPNRLAVLVLWAVLHHVGVLVGGVLFAC